MPVCTNCVLDDRFPGISFDESGVCGYCRARQRRKDARGQTAAFERRFRDLIDTHRRTSTYDCLVAYSGGKDSTYTLHLLKDRYHLHVLAYSFDNWYQSEAAARNIKTVLQSMSIDHVTVTPSYDTMRAIIRASISKDLHPPVALARASSICTSCISLIRFAGLRIAIEKGIPFVVFGFSPGQASLATSIVKTNPKMVRMMQGMLLERLAKRAGEDVRELFLEESHFEKEAAFPYTVNPLTFSDYDESRIYGIAHRYGWRKPGDTDANSTNCLLNALANYVHVKHFGFNPYAYEVAELVRSGRMSRSEGLARLASALPLERIHWVEQTLEALQQSDPCVGVETPRW